MYQGRNTLPQTKTKPKRQTTDISQTSSRLVNDSKKFKWGAKKLSLMVRSYTYIYMYLYMCLVGVAMVQAYASVVMYMYI